MLGALSLSALLSPVGAHATGTQVTDSSVLEAKEAPERTSQLDLRIINNLKNLKDLSKQNDLNSEALLMGTKDGGGANSLNGRLRSQRKQAFFKSNDGAS